MGWFGRDKMADAWSRAMENEGWYQRGYAKGLEHGKAAPVDAINTERERRGLIPLSRSENPRPEIRQTSTGPIANVIGIDFGDGDVQAMYPFSLSRKDSSMAQEKAFWFVVSKIHETLTVAGLTRYVSYADARKQADFYARTYPGEEVNVFKRVGSAKTQQPTIWTDYE